MAKRNRFSTAFKTASIVWGFEADAGFGDFSKGPDTGAANNYSSFDIDWNAHLRAKVGLDVDTTLIYVAGGLALADVTVDDTDPNWGQDDATHTGWTIGTGVEHAVNRHLKVRLEYLYDDYGSKYYGITGPFYYRANVDLTAHTVRAGLSYSF